jgi:hypothetical protein
MGVNLASNLNPAFLAFVPELAYDSWLTIGASQETPGYTLSTAVGQINPFTAFAAGQNVLVNDPVGFGCFNLFPGSYTPSNPAFAGADLEVLVGQITTSGSLSGQIYIQVFRNASQSQEFRAVFPIVMPAINDVPGCTDAVACNYAAEATEDDGSCTYAADGYDCAGTCLQDTDGDGVCNPFEIVGCTYPFACNYNPLATDQGTCDYLSCLGLGCNDPSACNYNPAALLNDGSCEYISCLVPGCTLPTACNFDPIANEDDGSHFVVNHLNITQIRQ